MFCDVTLDIGALVKGLAAERICTPVVACGVGTDTRRAMAPVKAPFSWPNNSLSSRFSGIAAQLTEMNAWSARADFL